MNELDKYSPGWAATSIDIGTQFTLFVKERRWPMIVVRSLERTRSPCSFCIMQKETPRNLGVSCTSLPGCSGKVFLHDTPEDRAEYITARLIG
jgi:hypothetical protein